jgi:DNA-binding response OmpR family regulator
MAGRATALLVDDDARLGKLLEEYLAQNEVDVTVATDGERGLRELDARHFDVVLLDIMLPGIDGLEVCRRVRARHGLLPVIMLTARGEEVDRVVGLELGADDYLPKPFSPRELLARIRALLRRAAGAAVVPGAERFASGALEIHFPSREVTVNGARLVLTQFEFELLATLARAAGRVLSREHLMEALKGEAFESFDRSIDVHVSKLRAKIEVDPKTPIYIKTVRGVGYVLVRE